MEPSTKRRPKRITSTGVKVLKEPDSGMDTFTCECGAAALPFYDSTGKKMYHCGRCQKKYKPLNF